MEENNSFEKNKEIQREPQKISEQEIFRKLTGLEEVVTKLSDAEKEKYEKLLHAAEEIKLLLEAETREHKELLLGLLEELINQFLTKLERTVNKEGSYKSSVFQRKKRKEHDLHELQKISKPLFALLLEIPREEATQEVYSMIQSMPTITTMFAKFAPNDPAFQPSNRV